MCVYCLSPCKPLSSLSHANSIPVNVALRLSIIADPILVEATGCAFQPPFLVLKRNSLQDLWVKADTMILSLPSLPSTLCPGRRVSGRHGLTSSNGTAGKLSMKSNNTYHIEVSHLCICTGLFEGDRKNRNMHIMEGLRSTRASCTGVV